MKLKDLCRELNLRNLTPDLPAGAADREVTAGYASDLLSDVLANAPRDSVLVTVQVHMNVIAVAVHAELAAVILADNRMPDETVCRKAAAESVMLLLSAQPAFEIAGRLYAMGLRGKGQ